MSEMGERETPDWNQDGGMAYLLAGMLAGMLAREHGEARTLKFFDLRPDTAGTAPGFSLRFRESGYAYRVTVTPTGRGATDAADDEDRTGPPKEVLLANSGMWVVFDADGKQIPYLQGPDSYALRDKMRRAYQGDVRVPDTQPGRFSVIPYPVWVTMPIRGEMLVTPD